MLLMDLGADGDIESVPRYAVRRSIENQDVSLILMGGDLIEGPDQSDACLDADDPACECNLSHTDFENASSHIVPRQMG